MAIRALLLSLIWLAVPVRVWAALDRFEAPNPLPPVIADATKAAQCTVIWLVSDITTNDTIAIRMRIAPEAETRPSNSLYPCPDVIAPRVAIRALDVCIARAADPKDCVYTDMGRDFEQRSTPNNSAENTSRCASDKATEIGVACWKSGELQICGVACGTSPASAIAAAVNRCESKHQKQCPITGSLPVLAPK